MKLTAQELELYQACRNNAVLSTFPEWSLLSFKGEDHLTFLQGQTTNDVLALQDGQGQLTSILDIKAKMRTLACLYRCQDSVYLMLPLSTRDAIFDHLNKYIILEDVTIDKLEYDIIGICGPESRSFLAKISTDKVRPQNIYEHQMLLTDNKKLPISLNSFSGEEDFLIFCKDGEQFINKLSQEHNIPVLTDKVKSCLQIEAGTPRFGIDVNENTMLPESGLQTSTVSYTKGCFVGQEIVARVKYRGTVNKSLCGVIFDDQAPESIGDFEVRGQRAGTITSLCYSPLHQQNIAMAYINKKYRTPGTRLNIDLDGHSYKAQTCLLPFYQKQSNIEEAEDLFHQAMDLFSGSDNKTDISAEPLLRKAISKNPKMADAYETLGVILSRHERYDEAIELMKQLKEIKPDEVMAYSNLSLFYMKKGMIPEAEEEKTAATMATFRKAANQRKERMAEDNLHQKQLEETKRRMGMFEQVLEIDADDLVANFGLGKAYVDLKEADKAIPFLKKCLDVKKDYTVAYLQLGLAYQQNNDQAQSIDIFKRGIICAIEKGDLMPKSEMERQLTRLEGSGQD